MLAEEISNRAKKVLRGVNVFTFITMMVIFLGIIPLGIIVVNSLYTRELPYRLPASDPVDVAVWVMTRAVMHLSPDLLVVNLRWYITFAFALLIIYRKDLSKFSSFICLSFVAFPIAYYLLQVVIGTSDTVVNWGMSGVDFALYGGIVFALLSVLHHKLGMRWTVLALLPMSLATVGPAFVFTHGQFFMVDVLSHYSGYIFGLGVSYILERINPTFSQG